MDSQMSNTLAEQYNPAEVEQQVQQRWERDHVFQVTEDPSKEKFIACPCSPTRAVNSTWGTCETILLVT